MQTPLDYPPAPPAAIPHARSRWSWAVWLLIPFAIAALVGPLIAFGLVGGDPGPVIPVETRVAGQPALAMATCFDGMSLTAVRLSTPDDSEQLWAASGRARPLPTTLRFDALPPGLTATSMWTPELTEQPVSVTYELTYDGQAEPWFIASDVVDFRNVGEGELVQSGDRVTADAVEKTCDGR